MKQININWEKNDMTPLRIHPERTYAHTHRHVLNVCKNE